LSFLALDKFERESSKMREQARKGKKMKEKDKQRKAKESKEKGWINSFNWKIL